MAQAKAQAGEYPVSSSLASQRRWDGDGVARRSGVEWYWSMGLIVFHPH